MVAPTDEVKDRMPRAHGLMHYARKMSTSRVASFNLSIDMSDFGRYGLGVQYYIWREAKITWTYDAWCIILLSLC
jgi:hypothetical protein